MIQVKNGPRDYRPLKTEIIFVFAGLIFVWFCAFLLLHLAKVWPYGFFFFLAHGLLMLSKQKFFTQLPTSIWSPNLGVRKLFYSFAYVFTSGYLQYYPSLLCVGIVNHLAIYVNILWCILDILVDWVFWLMKLPFIPYLDCLALKNTMQYHLIFPSFYSLWPLYFLFP